MKLSEHRPIVGLALGSGGPRGLAHIGVIKALLEHDIPIDIIAGTSAGSVIGGLYAAMGSINEVERIAKSLTAKNMFDIFRDIGLPSGVIRGFQMEKFLDSFIQGTSIETLPIPFAAVATDLSSGERVIIRTGSLTKAMHASSAVPGLIGGVPYGNSLLVDGGVSEPVPVRTVKDLGADFVIAVNLDSYAFIDLQSGKPTPPKIHVAGMAAINMLRYHYSKELCRDADVTIAPRVSGISSLNLMQFMNAEIISLGYSAAFDMIPGILKSIS